jgi:shikimate kinase
MNTLVLIGFRGAGKSTLAAALSSALGQAVTGQALPCGIFSTDEQIAERVGQPIAAFVAERGWEEFRRVEREVIHDFMNSPAQAAALLGSKLAALNKGYTFLVLPTILDCGGGVVEDAETMQLLSQNALVVWVDAEIEDLIARLNTADNAHRPLLNAGDMRSDIVENYARRKPLYERAAQMHVNTSANSSEEICKAICERWLRGKL